MSTTLALEQIPVLQGQTELECCAEEDETCEVTLKETSDTPDTCQVKLQVRRPGHKCCAKPVARLGASLTLKQGAVLQLRVRRQDMRSNMTKSAAFEAFGFSWCAAAQRDVRTEALSG